METNIILGIKVHSLPKLELMQKITEFLLKNKPHYITTINPEIILAAQQDEEYFYILNQANINIADGFGLKLAGWLIGQNIIRHTGSDLTNDLLKLATEKKLKVAIVNWQNGLSQKADITQAIKQKFPDLNFIVEDTERNPLEPIATNLACINIFAPQILLVSLGAPYQEKFIYHFLKQAPFIKIAIGVGGTFDFYTRILKRAPQIMRQLGLEWLWRLKEQPWRAKRIFNATFVFIAKFINYAFINPFLYRPNISCILYKRAENGYKILLIKRNLNPGIWQLPQGGIDHDDLITAGSREISEELNTKKFKPIVTYKNLYKYKWPKELINQQGINNIKTRGYKGQKQSLLIAEYRGDDYDIRLNFWEYNEWQWTDSDKILDIVEPARRIATKIFLEKFNELIKK